MLYLTPVLSVLAIAPAAMGMQATYVAAPVGAQTPTLIEDIQTTGDGSLEFLPANYPPIEILGPAQYGTWDFSANAGVRHEGVPFSGSGQSPPTQQYIMDVDGAWHGVLRADGSLQVGIDVPSGAYRLRMDVARPSNEPGNAPSITILMDGTVVHVTGAIAPGSGTVETDVFLVEDQPQTNPIHPFHRIQIRSDDPLASTVLFDDIKLERWSTWSEEATWAQAPTPFQVPGANDDVQIPSGAAVYLDGMCTARHIDVNGELRAPQPAAPQPLGPPIGSTPTPPAPIELAAQRITIAGASAALRAGSESAPYRGDFTIRLMNDAGTPHLLAGRKYLMAMDGGTLDLHGLPTTSWTQLVHTATAGVDHIFVDRASGWQTGDLIAVAGSEGQRQDSDPPASSANSHNPVQHDFAESFRVRAIAPATSPTSGEPCYRVELGALTNAAAPELTSELHLGVEPRMIRFQNIDIQEDLRAEVAHLTRNIVIRGELEAITPAAFGDHTGFGGHVMIMREACCTQAGRAYLENVEFDRMGQSRELGRYPMHWHMVKGEGAGQYMRGCAIHHAFNRGITIHGTADVEVSNNALYSVLGHSVFLEDGSETGNVLQSNLVVSMHRPAQGDQTSRTDNQLYTGQNRCPAAFWITNPDNIVDDNVAAGYVGTGFWLIFPHQVLGTSLTENYPSPGYAPAEQELGSFRGNCAHGLGMGFDVHDRIAENANVTPPVHTISNNYPYQPPSGFAEIQGFATYACQTGLYTGIAPGGIVFSQNYVADCELATRIASYDEVFESVLLADTGHGLYTTLPNGLPEQDCSLPGVVCEQTYSAYLAYDGAGALRTCYLDGFVGPNDTTVRMSSAANKHVNHRFESLTSPVPQILQFPDLNGCYNNPLTCPDGVSSLSQFERATFWGLVLHDVDGSIADPSGQLNLPSDLSIVSSHEMFDVPANVSLIHQNANGTPSYARVLDRHFTLLEVAYEDGIQGTIGNVGDFNVRYERYDGINAPQPTLFNRQRGFNSFQFHHMPIATSLQTAADADRILYVVNLTEPDGGKVAPHSGTPPANPNTYEFRANFTDGFGGEDADVVIADIRKMVAVPVDASTQLPIAPTITFVSPDPNALFVELPTQAAFDQHATAGTTAAFYDSTADRLYIRASFPAGPDPIESSLDVRLDW